MVVVKMPELNIEITDPNKARELLLASGVDYEHWEIRAELNEHTSPAEILNIYRQEIEELKRKGGYVTADVVDINPLTPGLEDMLDKFKREHYHSEDEVRFTVFGHGIFHVHPEGKNVIAIVVEQGDMIRVPKGMRHWFELCNDKRIKAVRLFQDKSGWIPHYVENGIHDNYLPICFGPAYINGER